MGYSKAFDVIVIGGGSTGLWTTLDLTLRGLSVLLIERNVVGSGTSGKFHGLLHSGARYVTTDPNSARECIQENSILSRIAPHAIEDTGGYFVSVTNEDEAFKDEFIKGLRSANIPYREVKPDDAFREEPELSREVKSVVEVPDKVIYAIDLLTSIEYTAFVNGALILEHAEVVKVEEEAEGLAVTARDAVKGVDLRFRARVVINAAGPWAGKVAQSAGVDVDVMPTAGTMVVFPIRLTRRVINRLRPPSDGDILVPYANTSIMGTTAFIVEDVDNIQVPQEDVELLVREGSIMIPRLRNLPIVRSYVSVRPLIMVKGGGRVEREASRDFQVVLHDRPRGFISVIGGKFTTGRLMGEKVGDAASGLLNVKKSSRTASMRLIGPDEIYADLAKKAGSINLIGRYRYSIAGGMDEDRGRVMLYLLAQQVVSEESRRALGLA